MKIFFLKSVGICILYLLFQYLFYSNTKDIFGVTAPFVSTLEAKGSDLLEADIVTLGSSIEYMKHPKDKDIRTVTQRLQDYLPDFKISAFSQPGYTMDLLNPFLKFIYNRIGKDKLYVIEFNWDQFSTTSNKKFMDRTPERIIYEDNFLSAFYRPLSVFNYSHGILTDQEFDAQEIYFEDKYMGQQGELYGEEDYQQMIKNLYMIQYMYKLDDQDKRIKAFKSLIAHSKQENIEILIYLTPFDYKSCQEFFTEKQCKETIDTNIKYIIDFLEENDVSYINLSKSLAVEHISTSPRFPNGHLKEGGREFVAKELKKWIDSNYSTKYQTNNSK